MAGSAAGVALATGAGAAVEEARASGDDGLDAFPQTDPGLVRAVVLEAHRSLDKVRELVESCQPLAKAAWDWGFGDWESALGAASHMGRRDIAEYLIGQGARPDIFTIAMLGDVAALQEIIAATPGVQRLPGPHGIPLLAHAQAGGAEAAESFQYLESLGDAGHRQQSEALSSEEAAQYIGRYQIEGGPAFEIALGRELLQLQRGDDPPRTLFHLGGGEFHPTGALGVRLTFDLLDGRAARVNIRGLGPSVHARRAG